MFWDSFIDLFGHTIGSIWNFLFNDAVIGGVSLGALLLVFAVVGIVVSFFFRGG